MPNHTTNRLTVSGPENKLAIMQEAMGIGDFCERILPMPFELRCHRSPADNPELERIYGAKDWYAWANKNWGTKWGVYNVGKWDKEFLSYNYLIKENDPDHNETGIMFQSAWNAPTLVIVKLSTYFPMLEFYLEAIDEGCGWASRERIVNGVFLEDTTFTEGDGMAEIGESLGVVLEL